MCIAFVLNVTMAASSRGNYEAKDLTAKVEILILLKGIKGSITVTYIRKQGTDSQSLRSFSVS